MSQIFSRLVDANQHGDPVAICVIVESHGSTPRHQGSKMLVFDTGKIEGTVGGGEIEARVITEALQTLKNGKPKLVKYKLNNPTEGDPGICGGQLSVYIDPILPPPTVVIIGAGHVGKAVTYLAKWLGFRVILSDDRPELCNPEIVPGADEYHPIEMVKLPDVVKITPQTYLVLTTRGSIVDIPGLPELLKTSAAYIGVIGSKRRWVYTKKGLIDAGLSELEINKVRSPIGTDINAETPEEIAVSIMGEIIQLRNSKAAGQ
jgi:xanthine dehydrogenase accessory factor